ncbi:MAG: hypothetical protein M1834_005249 [Cirrosporium novae-zelandiae]|nr:MAG: hypothetical protein M1834_005249 [Cirrosporium novae-zelandiae]
MSDQVPGKKYENQTPEEATRNQKWRVLLNKWRNKAAQQKEAPGNRVIQRDGKLWTKNSERQEDDHVNNGEEREAVYASNLEINDSRQYEFEQDTVKLGRKHQPKNATSYHPRYCHWGEKRENRAPILFELYRKDRQNPSYAPGAMVDDQGRVVLDPDGWPVVDWDLPTRIGSMVGGHLIETIRREDSRIKVLDLRARMLPETRPTKTALANRQAWFRRAARCVVWDSKERKGKHWEQNIINDMTPNMIERNSTRHLRDLTSQELREIEDKNWGRNEKYFTRARSKLLSIEERQSKRLKLDLKYGLSKERNSATSPSPILSQKFAESAKPQQSLSQDFSGQQLHSQEISGPYTTSYRVFPVLATDTGYSYLPNDPPPQRAAPRDTLAEAVEKARTEEEEKAVDGAKDS